MDTSDDDSSDKTVLETNNPSSLMETTTNSEDQPINIDDESSLAMDESSTSSLPKMGLKLVLKRHSGDKYEVKNSVSTGATSTNSATTTTTTTTYTTATNAASYLSSISNTNSVKNKVSTDTNNNLESMTGGRPKREAARKVKFTFSESEYDLDDFPLKKRVRVTQQSSLNETKPTMPQPPLPRLLLNVSTAARKNEKNANSNKKSFSSSSKQKTSEQTNRTYRIVNESKHDPSKSAMRQLPPPLPQPQPLPPQPEAQQEETQIPFELDEIVFKTVEEKLSIAKNLPSVVLNRSKPFPIALVEDKTNVVYTKALLFLHLFKSYSAPCINCPWCNRFLSVGEFSKHIHLDDMDDDDEEASSNSSSSGSSSDSSSDLSDSDLNDENGNSNRNGGRGRKQSRRQVSKRQKKLAKLMQKSFKILPYCTNVDEANDELSESDIKTWKVFGDRFTQFKLKRVQQQKKIRELNQLVNNSNSNSRSNSFNSETNQQLTLLLTNRNQHNNTTNNSSNNPSPLVKKSFDDWDRQEKDLYYIEKNKLDCEKVTYLNRNGTVLSGDEEEEEEDENEDEEVDVENNDDGAAIMMPGSKDDAKQAKITAKNDLSLSEDEDEREVEEREMLQRKERQQQEMKNKKPDHSLSDDDEEDEEKSKEKINEQENNNEIKKEEIKEPIVASKEANGNENSIKTCTCTNSAKNARQGQLPTLIQRFFNFYDNQPKVIFNYMLKNQFTILPVSYLNYSIRKRELYLKRLMLANTEHLKTVWLCLTLNLECNDKLKV